jgi:hypothetical protein
LVEGAAVEDGPTAQEPGPDRRDTSNLTLALTIGYVRARLGDEGVTDLLRIAGETRSLAELSNEGRWSTQEQKMALFTAAAELLDDPEVARRIGETVLDQQTGAGHPRRCAAAWPRPARSSPPTTRVKPSPSAATRP